MKPKMILLSLIVCLAVSGSPTLHKCQFWGEASRVEKLHLFIGWTNGYLPGKGQKGLAFASCLEKIDYTQSVAMIDKQYRDHPEKWSQPLGLQFLEALTVEGSPCEGTKPD
jgi:hypothetical protein